MSYPDTLGFAPIVNVSSPWFTAQGQTVFLKMVTDRAKALSKSTPTLTYTNEMNKALIGAIGCPDTLGTGLRRPSPSILQAVEYMALTVVERLRMSAHLQQLRSRSCITVQPRGCSDASRQIDMYGPQTAGVPGTYQRYLAHQHELRLRYA